MPGEIIMSKITEIRTIRIAERPNQIWVEIETDEKLVVWAKVFVEQPLLKPPFTN